MSKGTIYFVFTSADRTLDNKEIGWYLPEAAHPYHILSKDYNIIGISPKGGKAPLDADSAKNFMDDQGKFLLEDEQAKKIWSETKKISEVEMGDAKAIFIVGGHGPMMDLAKDEVLGKLLSEFYANKRPVAAVCHGPAGLILAKTPSGESILNGINVTGFSNGEEAQTPYSDMVNTLPFSLEEKLKSLGGKYGKAEEDWAPKVFWDGGVLTGQNPASAGPIGQKLKEILAA